ncbi:MAG: hypothetical protein GYA23_12495 [Methanomicrobiales archaeon]|nr:hypothetical protein [Methanomicrobiales archaeon]
MGRSFLSVRLGVKALTERWERAGRKQDRDHRGPAAALATSARRHSSEAFFGCDSPLEAVLFSSLVEISREDREQKSPGGNGHVDP